MKLDVMRKKLKKRVRVKVVLGLCNPGSGSAWVRAWESVLRCQPRSWVEITQFRRSGTLVKLLCNAPYTPSGCPERRGSVPTMSKGALDFGNL